MSGSNKTIGLLTMLCTDYQQNIHPKNQEHVCAVREQLPSEQETPAEPRLKGFLYNCVLEVLDLAWSF